MTTTTPTNLEQTLKFLCKASICLNTHMDEDTLNNDRERLSGFEDILGDLIYKLREELGDQRSTEIIVKDEETHTGLKGIHNIMFDHFKCK